MWVCTSMPPGMTYLPVASIVRSAVTPAGWPGAESAAMVSPSMRTSVGAGARSGPTTVPSGDERPRHDRRQVAVGVGPAVAVEGPAVADLGEQVEVEVADDQLGIVVVADVADELALRVDEVRRAVEVVVAERLDADAVDGADEVLVGHRDAGCSSFHR